MMNCYTINVLKEDFNKSIQFFAYLDGDYSYLYKEFHYTYDVYIEKNNDVNSEEILFYARTDHDYLKEAITKHFFINENRLIEFCDPIDIKKWKYLLGRSNVASDFSNSF